jgi:hypothetical protein
VIKRALELYDEMLQLEKKQLKTIEAGSLLVKDLAVQSANEQFPGNEPGNVLARLTLITSAHAAHRSFMGLARASYKAAVAAIDAVITAYKLGEYIICENTYNYAIMDCNVDFTNCMPGGDPGICLKCDGHGNSVNDNTEDPGPCKKCKNGVVVEDCTTGQHCCNGACEPIQYEYTITRTVVTCDGSNTTSYTSSSVPSNCGTTGRLNYSFGVCVGGSFITTTCSGPHPVPCD